MIVRAGPCLPPHAKDVEENQEIENADDPEKGARDRGTGYNAEVFQRWKLIPDDRGSESNADRETQDNCGMPEREEEANPQRPLSLLQHIAHGIVDRRDVICIESMAQPEHVCDESQANERRVAHTEV